MSENNLKDLINAFSNYVSLAQKAKGELSTIYAKQNINIDKFLTGFYSFDIFCYAIIDVSELKILKFGGATQQLTGYDPDYFEGKSYYKFLKLHSVKDLLKSLLGGYKYFNYLYSQKKEKRPFIDVIDDYISRQDITPEQKKEIIDLWRTRSKALSLPKF
jgi:hypothetical protein